MQGGRDEARLQRRVGTTVGSATVLTLILYPFLMVDPLQSDRLDVVPYLVIVGLGSLAAVAVSSRTVVLRLPVHHRPVSAYAATALLLATISGAIAFSGGSISELHHLLALPLVFAAMAYPRRVLLALLVLAVALVALVQVVTSSPFLPARTVARIATVGGTVLATSWLTAAHTRQLRRTQRAHDETDHQAATLRALARSAADINDLDHQAVLAATVSTAVRIGYVGAAFVVVRQGGIVVLEHAGALTPERTEALLPEHDLRNCLEAGSARTHAVDGLALRCLPMVVDGRTVGALVGAAEDDAADADGVGLQILGAQAMIALTNAHRFRSARELVDQLRDVQRLRHDLVSTASHELRTPTTVIKGAAELLDARWDELEDAERRQLIERMGVHIEALEHVLDQLAAFMDHDTGTAPRPEHVPLELAELVEDCIDRSRAALVGHDIIARLAPAEVTGDARSLRRAVSALLDNVATHTPTGTTVRIITEATADGAVLVVDDDGEGVPAEAVSTLLDPFARSGEVLTRGTRGVGLGLTLVDHTVRAHGGEVVLSTDHGFAVRILLPNAADADSSSGSRQWLDAAPGSGAGVASDQRAPQVLVVEDDVSLRQLATLTLQDAGCVVRATGDGRNAVSLAAAEAPDVVVLDVDLPGLDGREVAQVLRDDPATADVPIVVVTGSADRAELWTIWASGADALLTKPYDVTELATTVLDLAERGDGAATATATDAPGLGVAEG